MTMPMPGSQLALARDIYNFLLTELKCLKNLLDTLHTRSQTSEVRQRVIHNTARFLTVLNN